MTATEPEAVEAFVAPVETNGNAPTSSDDGIEYLPNGTARFTIEGKTYTLHPPTIGQFKRLHAHWIALGQKPATEQLVGQLAWVKLLFNGDDESPGLSDKRLPDSEDEWAAWVGVAVYQLELMTHFRDVPLARGGSVKAAT